VPGYKPLPDIDKSLIPVEVKLPLCLEPFVSLLGAAKECLQNNFLSCFATIAGSATLFHYQSICEQQDTCPLVLCYSTSCGTGMNSLLMSVNHSGYIGKTTALQIALSIYGTLKQNINNHKTSSSSLLLQAALGSIPIGKFLQ